VAFGGDVANKKAPEKAPERKAESGLQLPPRYELKKKLGQGAYGSVYEAFDGWEKRRVAIKRVQHLFDEPFDCKRILREITILSGLRYKHIVQIYDLPLPSDPERFNELFIVMEMVDTDLKKLCKDTNITLTPPHINTLLYNLLLGLLYLHSAGVYHRDLTPGNCLVNRDLTVKICDFGLSRAIVAERLRPASAASKTAHSERKKRELTAHVVTRWYRAPELILLRDHYTEAIDVWSAGCIFAELVTTLDTAPKTMQRRALFPGTVCYPMSPDPQHRDDVKFHTNGHGRDQLNVIFSVLGSPTEAEIEEQEGADARKYLRRFDKQKGVGLKSKFSYADAEAIDMLERMLRFNPKKRISVTEAFEHKLFAEVRDPSKEVTAPSLVTLDFENEEDLDEAQLRQHFFQEISKFHPEMSVAPPSR